MRQGALHRLQPLRHAAGVGVRGRRSGDLGLLHAGGRPSVSGTQVRVATDQARQLRVMRCSRTSLLLLQPPFGSVAVELGRREP